MIESIIMDRGLELETTHHKQFLLTSHFFSDQLQQDHMVIPVV